MYMACIYAWLIEGPGSIPIQRIRVTLEAYCIGILEIGAVGQGPKGEKGKSLVSYLAAHPGGEGRLVPNETFLGPQTENASVQ